jgi:hypothetical protein
MGRLTLQRIGIQTSPHPTNPGQVQVSIAMGAGGQLLAQEGIVLDVAIELDNLTSAALRAQNQPIPTPLNCKALVDTGASGLALDATIIQRLGLVRKGVLPNLTAAGPRAANVYFVGLSFPGSELKSYPLLRAMDCNLTGQPFRCLIGRETMRNWHLHYNGESGAVSISD